MTTFKLALSFLTRLPIGHLEALDENHWPESMAFFPACGLILSLLVFAPTLLLLHCTHLSPITAAALAAVLLIYWTGGLHIDGFADCCDGFGCPADREKCRQIMKDPTIGSFAAAGLIGLLILKTTAIAQVFTQPAVIPLIYIPAAARFIPVLLSRIGTYPNSSGIGKFTVGKVGTRVVLSAFITLLPMFIYPKTLAAFAVMLFASVLLKRKSDRLIGGITGDVLGAAIELSETVGFVTLSLFAN